jgi:adenylate cyclase
MGNEKKRTRLTRLQFFALCVAGIYFFSAFLNHTGTFDDFKLSWWDWLITSFEARKPPQEMLLLSIDNDDLKTIGPWPWDRRKLAHVVDFLHQAGAKVIAFDIFFRKEQKGQDEEFLKAIKRHGKVILAQPWDSANNRPEVPPENFLKAHLTSGHVARTESRVYRSVNLVLLDSFDFSKKKPFEENYHVPAFSLVAVRAFLGLEKEPLCVESSPWSPALKTGALRIPVFSTGLDVAGTATHMFINFSGGPRHFLENHQAFSISSIVNDKPDETDIRFRDEIAKKAQGSLVLIYNTFDPNDQFNTPYTAKSMAKGSGISETMPGGEIHAHSICTLLEHRFISYLPVLEYTLPLIFLCLGALILVQPLKWGARILLFIALLAAWGTASTILFTSFRILTNLYFPLFALIALFISLIIYERKQFVALFGEFVSHRLKDQVLMDDSKGAVGTREVEATIVFADIRGFSTFSEKLSPQELTDRMTEYHTSMNRIFENNKGLILDYLGDAEMVGFGILGEDREHPLRAIKSGLEMQEAIALIRKEWNLPGGQLFEVGVGICTGMVAEGIVGSEGVKKQLVSMGDTTNTAARIQALSKDLDSLVTISESTYVKVQDDINADPLKEMPLKGKTQKVMLYRVNSIKDEALKRLQA